jgi:predicted enzyme related to lactoylglutathione lyase
MDGTKMGLFPGDGDTVSVALVSGEQYKTSLDGCTVYLNAGKDLQIALDRITANGGKIIVPKTLIAPEIGFYAMFIDTEGNKLGLHSIE